MKKLWTKQNEKMLIKLRNKNVPMNEIAKRMGLTKGMVAGKIFRLRALPEPQVSEIIRIPKINKSMINKSIIRKVMRKIRRNRHFIEKIPLPLPVATPPDCKPTTILERRMDQCAYPIGHRIFCGAEVCKRNVRGNIVLTSWCDYHWNITHVKRSLA